MKNNTKKYVTFRDNPGERLEMIDIESKVIIVKSSCGIILNIPAVYLMDYQTWIDSKK